MIVLGIDPGSRNLAAAAIRDQGRRLEFVEGFRLHAEGDFLARAEAVSDLADEWLAALRPAAVACEDVFLQGRSTTVHQVSHIIGLLHARARSRGIPFVLLAPSEVKGAVLWGRADKDALARAVSAMVAGVPERLYGPGGRPVQAGSHLYDAVAVAVAALTRLRWERIRKEVAARVAVYGVRPAAPQGRGRRRGSA
ncbi:MAG TPA: crossover junction endodeoxyribonuclease RuvC [Thermaerobacter sp.]